MIGEPKAMALGLLNEILSKKLGIHLYEPQIKL